MHKFTEKKDLIDIQRDYIKTICKSIDGLKCMIFDKSSSELISLNFLQSEAFELEVFLFEDIKNIEDEKMHYVSAIYIIAQPQQSIQYIQKELQNPNFKEYHFFFLADVPDDLIRRFAEFDQYDLVKNLQRLYCNYHAINQHLYHSNVYDIHNIFDKSLDQWQQQERQNLFQIEESIISSFMSLRKKPIIQYVKQSNLCSQLAHNLDQKFQKLNLQFRNEFSQSHPLLIILDRKEDPFTPLLQEWSYQNLLHELIGINNNKITAKGKEYNLSLQYDDFYKNNLYSNYSEVANNLKNMIQKLSEQKQQYKNLKKFKDMQKALSSMHDYQKESSITEKHLNLTDQLTKIIESRNLINISQFQQQLVSKNQKKNHQKEIEKFINDPSTQPKEKLILVCLFTLIYQDSESSNSLEQNLLLQYPNYQYVLQALKQKCQLQQRTLNFLDVNKDKDFFSVYKDLFQQQQNAFELHIPLVCILIQEILKGKNMNQKFSTINSNNFGNINNNLNEIMIYIVGGVTYSEAKKINDLNKIHQGKQIWIGGTSMINSSQFISEYLGQKIQLSHIIFLQGFKFKVSNYVIFIFYFFNKFLICYSHFLSQGFVDIIQIINSFSLNILNSKGQSQSTLISLFKLSSKKFLSQCISSISLSQSKSTFNVKKTYLFQTFLLYKFF